MGIIEAIGRMFDPWQHEAERRKAAEDEAASLRTKEQADHKAWLRENAASVVVPEHPAVALLREVCADRCWICDCEGRIGHDDGCSIGELCDGEPRDRALSELLVEARAEGEKKAQVEYLASMQRVEAHVRGLGEQAALAKRAMREEGFAAGEAHGENLGAIKVEIEREGCANLAKSLRLDGPNLGPAMADYIADAIRARSPAERSGRMTPGEQEAAEETAAVVVASVRGKMRAGEPLTATQELVAEQIRRIEEAARGVK